MDTVRMCFILFTDCINNMDNTNMDNNILLEKDICGYNIDELKNKSHVLYMQYIIKNDMFSTDSRVSKAYNHLIKVIEDVKKDQYKQLSDKIEQLEIDNDELNKENSSYKSSFFYEPEIIKEENYPKKYKKPGWMSLKLT